MGKKNRSKKTGKLISPMGNEVRCYGQFVTAGGVEKEPRTFDTRNTSDPYVLEDVSAYLYKRDTTTFNVKGVDCLTWDEYAEKVQKAGTAKRVWWHVPTVTDTASDRRGQLVSMLSATVKVANLTDDELFVRGSSPRVSINASERDLSGGSITARDGSMNVTLKPRGEYRYKVNLRPNGTTQPSWSDMSTSEHGSLADNVFLFDFALVKPNHPKESSAQADSLMASISVHVHYHVNASIKRETVIGSQDVIGVQSLRGVESIFDYGKAGSVKPGTLLGTPGREIYLRRLCGKKVLVNSLDSGEPFRYVPDGLEEGDIVEVRGYTRLGAEGDKYSGIFRYTEPEGLVLVDELSVLDSSQKAVVLSHGGPEAFDLFSTLLTVGTSILGVLTGKPM